MKKGRLLACTLALALALPLAACSVAPHGRTVVLPRPEPSATATPAVPGKLSFELEKAATVPVRNFDQAGYFLSPDAQFVYGWLDDNHLAAIGVAPLAPENGTAPTAAPGVPQAKARAYFVSAAGLVGQILSVDWQTGKTEEVHTVQNQVITSMGLSRDRSKLWYCSTDGEKASKLIVSDVSFRHVLLEISDFLGFGTFWSSRGKYLGYMSFEKARPMLMIFDGVETRAVPSIEPYYGGSAVYIDDDTDSALTFFKGMLLARVALGKPDKPATMKLPAPMDPVFEKQVMAGGRVVQPVLTDSGLLLYEGAGGDGSVLEVVDLQTMDVVDEYEGVMNFALSEDSKYICLVRQAAGGAADIYVGEWHEGSIANEKLVFKGFYASGGMFFSPDDAKLYIEGSYGYADAGTTSMVLKFK